MEEYGKTKEEQKKLKREDFDTAKEYYAAKAQKQSELDAI
jgi:hypothetical protein